MATVALSVDRLVVVALDPDLPRDEAIQNAVMFAADEFGRMMDAFVNDPDEETIIVLEEYDD